MKYLPLVWAALWRKRVRTLLTLLSVSVAFTLFGMLVGFNATFQHMIDMARPDRITINSRFGGEMPISMAAELRRLPGVTQVAGYGFLFGNYRKPGENVFAFFIDRDTQRTWAELPITDAHYRLLEQNPTGVLISRKRAERHNLKVGDNFPITSNDTKRADGKNVWPMKVLAIT